MDEDSRIKLPSVKVGIGTLFTIVISGTGLMAAIFWMYSDKHNNEIFLPRSEYQKDQVYISQTVKDIRQSQEETAREQKVYNSEMRSDIKQILKEQSKK